MSNIQKFSTKIDLHNKNQFIVYFDIFGVQKVLSFRANSPPELTSLLALKNTYKLASIHDKIKFKCHESKNLTFGLKYQTNLAIPILTITQKTPVLHIQHFIYTNPYSQSIKSN
jgi:hypothetical protein